MGAKRRDVVFFAVLAALIGGNVLIYVLWQPHHGGGSAAGTTVTTTEPASTARGIGTPAGAPSPGASTSSSTTTARPSAKPTRSRAHRRRHVRGRVQAGVRLVVSAARGPTWLIVRQGSATGAIVFDDVLGQGDRLQLSGRALYARFGSIGNVDVRVGGRAVDLHCVASGGVLLTRAQTIPLGGSTCLTVVGS